MEKRVKVFISYSTKDNYLVNKYRDELIKNKFDVWMAPWSIPPGSNYASSIPLGIKSCDIFIIFISSNSIKSKWVEHELLEAVGTKGDEKIIPIYIEEVELPNSFKFAIKTAQAITYNKNSINPTKNLFEIIDRFYHISSQPLTTIDIINKAIKKEFIILNQIFTSLDLSYSDNKNSDSFNLDLMVSSFDKSNQELSSENLQNTNNKYVVYGNAGAGKSTTIKKFLYEIALINEYTTKKSIPIYINLALLDNTQKLTAKYLAECLAKKVNKKITIEDIEKMLYTNHLVIAFDGLDEFSTENIDKRNELLVVINKLTEALDCSIIIGCRNKLNRNINIDDYIYVEVEPLNQEQVINFMNNYFIYFNVNIDAKDFYKSLPKELASTLKTPLLLSILIALYFKTKTIPKNINDLYKLYIERLIDKNSPPNDANYLPQMFLMYCKIAFEILIKGKTTIPLIALRKTIKNVNKTNYNDHFVETALLNTGLMLTDNQNASFLHASFMEYLAGLECKQEYSFFPKEYMDQYFLKNEDIIKKIINVANISIDDKVIEVGAGIGSVASYYPKCHKLYLVDLDDGLCKILKYNFRNYSHCEVIKMDAIKALNELTYNKIISNLPFFLTNDVLSALKNKDFDVAIMSVRYEDKFDDFDKHFSIVELAVIDGSCFYPEQPFKSKLIMIKKK